MGQSKPWASMKPPNSGDRINRIEKMDEQDSIATLNPASLSLMNFRIKH
jgi:hypothetical protein